MNRQLLNVLVLAALVVSISSCRVFRKVSRRKVMVDTTAIAVQPVDTVAEAAPPKINEEKRKLIAEIAPLYNEQLNFSTFSGKAKMHFEGKGQKHEFTANIRIKNGQVIWVSVTALGGIVQVARVLITPDSIKIVNYLERNAIQMGLSDASKILPVSVDFATLQNLIIGNVLRSTGTPTDATDFGGTYTLIIDEDDFTQQIAYNKADNSMRSLQIKAKKADGMAGVIQYGDYEAVQGRRFANSRVISIMDGAEQYYMDMNFNNASFDQTLDFPYSVPKNYTRK